MPHRINADDARAFSRLSFLRCGLAEDDAEAAADVLVWASLRGVDTHGIRNLKRYYVDGLTDGTIRRDGEYAVASETPVAATVDGGGGLGLSTAHRAMQLAISKAHSGGLGVVTVRNSHHFGAAGYFAHLAVAHDMIGLCANGYFFHNGQEAAVVPFGGLLPMLSTNPLAMAAPADAMPPFVLDMSTSVVPVNRLELMQELGRSIPLGWGLTADDAPTTEPSAVRKLLPLGGPELLGGHKGYGLALGVQILAGVLSGAWKRDADADRVLGDHPAPVDGFAQEGVGHVFAAIRIDAFGSAEAFKQGMDVMTRQLNHSPAVPGRDRVVVPGQVEAETAAERLRDGIPLNEPTVADLRSLSQRFDIPLNLR